MYYILKFASAEAADAFWEQLGSAEHSRWQIFHIETGSFCIIIPVVNFRLLPEKLQNIPEDKTRVSQPVTMWVQLLATRGWAAADSIE